MQHHSFFFVFNDTATTETYTLSLHDALPISAPGQAILSTVPNGQYGTWSGTSMAAPLVAGEAALARARFPLLLNKDLADRKSTRLNSSHSQISYAVFCLKKKKNK